MIALCSKCFTILEVTGEEIDTDLAYCLECHHHNSLVLEDEIEEILQEDFGKLGKLVVAYVKSKSVYPVLSKDRRE